MFHDYRLEIWQEGKSPTGLRGHLLRTFLWSRKRLCLPSEQKQMILGGISVILCPSRLHGPRACTVTFSALYQCRRFVSLKYGPTELCSQGLDLCLAHSNTRLVCTCPSRAWNLFLVSVSMDWQCFDKCKGVTSAMPGLGLDPEKPGSVLFHAKSIMMVQST